MIALDGGTPAPLSFTVEGVSGSTSVPVNPALLDWVATRNDDTSPGSVDAGVYWPNPAVGGTVTIDASGCGANGSATVTLDLSYTTTADGGPLATDFSGPVVDGGPNAPVIVYPSAETRFPRNVYKILFQWTTSGNTLFRLTFTGPGSTVVVYTQGDDPACAGVAKAGCWLADQATWQAIAASNAGSTVTVEVDGTPAAGSTVYASAREVIGFSRRDVTGAIFYWAANEGGVLRATVSDAAPEPYIVGQPPNGIPPTTLGNGDSVQCAACHTVSRDGTRMAVSGQANGPVSMGHGLWSMVVTPTPPPTIIQSLFPDAEGDGFSSFSPDDQKLVWSARNGGPLVVVDATSGASIGPASMGGPMGMGGAPWGLAPDWAPWANVDVFAYQDQQGNIDQNTWYDDGGYGDAGILAPAPMMGGHPNEYPRYSPDGDWVAYSAGNTMLYVVSSDGGPQVQLTAADLVVNNGTWNPSENSMPTWAPPGDLNWVAFNSQRAYGLLTNGGNNQIWVAAIDFARLAADGGDPSYPGFWLPFQVLSTLNHRAFWTLDVRDTVDAGVPDAGSCAATGQICGGSRGCCDAAEACTYFPDFEATLCAPPPVDAGAPDAGPCYPNGVPCDPTGSEPCCGQFSNGEYCGLLGGTYQCTAP